MSYFYIITCNEKRDSKSLPKSITDKVLTVEGDSSMFRDIEKVLDILPLPAFVVQDGYFCMANSKMLTFTGHTKEQLLLTKHTELIHPDDRKTVLYFFQKRMNGENVPETCKYKVISSHGEELYIKGFFSLFRYNHRPALLGQIINITKPELAKEELNIQKAYFQQLFDNSPEAIVILNNSDSIIDVNKGFEKIFGFPAEEVKGCFINNVIVPDALVDEASGLSRRVIGGESVVKETIRKRRDGSFVYVSTLAFPILLYDRQVGLYAIYSDITEGRLAQEKLKESEEKYRLVFENAPLGILHFNESGIITAVNENLVKTLGSSREGIIGLDLLQHPDSEVLCAVKNAISGRMGRYEGYYRSYTSPKITPIKADFAPVIIDDSSVVGGVGIIENTTDRMRAVEDLSREKERLAVTLSSIGDAVIAVDNGGLVTMINPVAHSLTGWDRDEAMGRPLEEVFNVINEYTREIIQNPVQKVLAEGKTVGLASHVALVSRDGKTYLISYSAAPIQDANGEILGVILVFRDITEERNKEAALGRSEQRFRNMVETTNDCVWEVDQNGKYSYVSPQIKKLLGYDPDEMVGKRPFDFMPADEARRIFPVFTDYAANRQQFSFLENINMHKDGRLVVLEASGVPFFDAEGRFCGYRGIDRDITERKSAEKDLSAALRKLQDIIEFLPDATFVVDRDRKVIAWNRAMEEMSGVSKEETIGRCDSTYTISLYGKPRQTLIDFIFVDSPNIDDLYENVERRGDTLFAESFVPFFPTKKGAYIWVKASPLYDRDKNLVGAIESIRDITERKQMEDQLKYLSLHDSLTGLYNRAYFEEEMRRLEGGRYVPIGIILFDVDGLKLVNDTLGHSTGDKLLIDAANVSRDSFRSGDVVARIGGDEFAILLPNAGYGVVESACERIKENLNSYNAANPQLPLSLSIGFATSNNPSINLGNLFKEADNNMHREKLHHSQSARSAIVQTLMKALEARDYITEGHADRIRDLVASMAIAIGLPERSVTDLRLLAQFHDIGKVGIPDRILFKTGPLNSEEFNEMKRHSEIGYRIAQSAPDLVHIADWILKHHEWWNGGGYPLGIKGEEIPLECRILSIADAYDAMTSDRPYRKAMTNEGAMGELKRCASIQFDPLLSQIFIKLLEDKG